MRGGEDSVHNTWAGFHFLISKPCRKHVFKEKRRAPLIRSPFKQPVEMRTQASKRAQGGDTMDAVSGI